MIREAVVGVDPGTLRSKKLARDAVKDLAGGGTPEDVYAWLAAETELPDGRHRANAIVVLVKKIDPVAGAKLSAVAEPSKPPPYVAPYQGASGREATKMYESAGTSVVLYHGTLSERVPSILSSGLRATEGWGGAANPGVFLSPTREAAEYWGTAALLKKLGLPVPQGVDLHPPPGYEGDVSVLAVEIPPEESDNVVPRRKSFSLPGDVQFVGSIPPEWISDADSV